MSNAVYRPDSHLENRLMMQDEVPFTLKTLSDRAGIPKETLRGWLGRKAIDPIGSNAQGFPVFNAQTVARAIVIRELRKKGFGWDLIGDKSVTELQRLSCSASV